MGAPSPAPHHLSAPGTGVPTRSHTEPSAWFGRWSWLWEATLGGHDTQCPQWSQKQGWSGVTLVMGQQL